MRWKGQNVANSLRTEKQHCGQKITSKRIWIKRPAPRHKPPCIRRKKIDKIDDDLAMQFTAETRKLTIDVMEYFSLFIYLLISGEYMHSFSFRMTFVEMKT